MTRLSDPYGLGELLYGLGPADVSPHAPGWLLAAGGTFMTLIPDQHDGCAISSFCRNPLHPGPCKGWKKGLGVSAPGALKAINAAHAEKVAARRVKVAEAKSAAAKQLTEVHHASPLHAKKAVIKKASLILGDNEHKAAKKADRVVLNKTEIKKYSKIKAAQITAMRGEVFDSSPESQKKYAAFVEGKIADALAADNEGGSDANYRAAVGNIANALTTGWANKHCAEHDGDCDGLLNEGDKAMLHALLTGDTGPLLQLEKDFKADKPLTPVPDPQAGTPREVPPAPAAPKKTPGKEGTKPTNAAMGAASDETLVNMVKMHGSTGKGAPAAAELERRGLDHDGNPLPEKAPAATPPDGAVAKKLTIGEAGLQDGDKVWVYPTAHNWTTHDGKKGTSWMKGKEPGQPQLATVKKSKGNNLGLAKGVTIYDFVGENGEELGGGTGSAKNWISPVDKPSFDDPAPKPSKTKAPKLEDFEPPAEVKKLLAAIEDPGSTDQQIADAAKGIDLDLIKQHLSPQQQKDLASSMVHASKVAVPPKPTDVALINPDHDSSNGFLGDGEHLSKEKFDGLPEDHKAKVIDRMQGIAALWDPNPQTPSQEVWNDKAARAKAVLAKWGVPEKAPKVGKPDLHEMFGPDGDPDHAQAVKAVIGMDQADWDSLSDEEKTNAALHIADAKGFGAPGAHEAQKNIASLLMGKTPAAPGLAPAGPTPALTPNAQKASDYAHGVVSATATKKLTAYDTLTGDDFGKLPPETQKLILADLAAVKSKLTSPAKKANAQAVANYLSPYAGGGTGAGGGLGHLNPAATPAEKTAKVVATQKEIHHLLGLPVLPGAEAGWAKTIESGTGAHNAVAVSAAQHYAAAAVAKLELMHSGAMPDGLDPIAHAVLKDNLKNELLDKLEGGSAPSPTYNAWKKAIESGDIEDAYKVAEALPSAGSDASLAPPTSSPNASLDAVIGSKKDSILGIRTPIPGVLFSAYKAAHKGSVLSHSKEDQYNNLLAVVKHYAGRVLDDEAAVPNDLTIAQVAKIVDNSVSGHLDTMNIHLLENTMLDWLATPEGRAYAEAHPMPGKKWLDNLNGDPSGEAKKIKLPDGAKVQTVKGPGKYDPAKSADDFAPLSSYQIQDSQREYMDGAGKPWTAAQMESLKNYTTGSYYELNSYLRGVDPYGKKVDAISEIGADRIKTIQAGMRPLQQDTLLKRGTNWEQFPEGFRDPQSVKKLIGKTLREPAFMSTTVGGESGEFYKSVRLMIEAPTGTQAAWVNHISHNSGENEVILAAGTKYRVLSVEDSGGPSGTIIRVRVVS